MTCIPNNFQYKRIGWKALFWRERFELTDSFCWGVPAEFQDAIGAVEVETEFFSIRQFECLSWYFIGRKPARWDGATGVPTTRCVVLASWTHDMVYQHIRAIARAWYGADTWRNRRKVRKWSDLLFKWILKDEGSWSRVIYPLGVDLFAGFWNEVGLIFR